MAKLRAALIGCGRIGSDFDKEVPTKRAFSHAGAYRVCPSTELVTAADPDAAKRSAFSQKWGVRSVHADYRRMLRDERIDILSVATPPETHWDVIREACQTPVKAIYCEKPIAGNMGDARKIVALCKRKNVLLVVNHQRRFGAFYRELKAKLAGGTLGRVQQVTCYYTRGIANTCTHVIDLFVFLFGDIVSVSAEFSRSRSPFAGDPNLDATLRFKSGLSVSLKACDDSAFLILEIDILTEKARIRMGETLDWYQARPGKNLLKLNELVLQPKAPMKAEYPRYGMVSLDRGVEHLVKCLRGSDQPVSTGENATQALGVIESLLESARTSGGKGSQIKVKR